MNQEQARDLVRQTLTQSFEKRRFRNFVLELLNDFDESKAQSMAVPEAFAQHVRSCLRLGTYKSPNDELLDVLIVNTTEPWKLERTRSALRAFVAHKLKRGDNEKDAALVAFVSPTEKQWRFSYVKMEYATVAKDSGKVGVETRLTPARRFSYIVGEGESCHTAQTRFLDLLRDTDKNPTLAQLEEAFSVEAVTKEFFKKYAELFEEIKAALDKLAKKDAAIGAEFTKKRVKTADFAKKLMGQIVFLYFIQKKGWLGVAKGQDWGTGPHDFLGRLARGDYGQYHNFFNDVLEPLFYSTLAEDRGHEAWCKRFNCRIPFLNGGLFEPLADYNWRKTDITLPNRLFTNNEQFDDFTTGTGLLDMFDRYNFTVNEAEPLEKEVAIDPEMLGKVFENLIEENLRKGLGSYYTPREIVHYMCQESLINYLDTALNSATEIIGREKRKQAEFADEKSEQTLLTAPARNEVVSRADIETFVHLGDQISHYEAVETRYAIKMPKSIEKNARLIDQKLADITICDPAVGSGAFPVGMMTEIVRARSALTPYFNDVHERTPYHFKRHAIQTCLYGVDIDPGAVEIAKLRLWLSLVVDEEDVKQIKPLPNLLYKIVTGNSLLGVEQSLFNRELFRRLEELKPRYFDEPDKDKKDSYKQQIEETIHELTNGKEAFDFNIYFSEVFHRKRGFDVIIANPPYVSYYSRESASTEETDQLLSELRSSFVFTKYSANKGRLNLWMFFAEKFVDLLATNGTAVFLADVNFTKDVSKNIRRFLIENSRIGQFIHDLSEFENVASGQVILITQRGIARESDSFLIKSSLKDDGILQKQKEVSKPAYSFLGEIRDPITAKVSKCHTIQQIPQIRVVTGVQVGGTELYKGKEVKEHFYRQSWDGKKTFPSVLVRSVTRYGAPIFQRGILFDYKLASEITKHTKKSAVVLEKYSGFLHREKILLRQSAATLIATLGPKDCCGEYSLFSLLCETDVFDIHYLLGLLNSNLLTYFALKTAIILCKKGTQPQIRKAGIETLGIPTIPLAAQAGIGNTVKRIMAAKRKDAHADVSQMERETMHSFMRSTN